jgi:hypothetical protein
MVHRLSSSGDTSFSYWLKQEGGQREKKKGEKGNKVEKWVIETTDEEQGSARDARRLWPADKQVAYEGESPRRPALFLSQ